MPLRLNSIDTILDWSNELLFLSVKCYEFIYYHLVTVINHDS